MALRHDKRFRLLVLFSFILLLVLIVYVVKWRGETSIGTSLIDSRGQSAGDEHEDQSGKDYNPSTTLNVLNTDSDGQETEEHRQAEDDPTLPPPCTFEVCFNLRKCPLTRPFTVYVYDYVTSSGHDDTRDQLVTALEQTGSYTSDPGEACLFLGILWNREGEGENSVESLEKKIHSLEYWGENGENHILIELSTDRSPPSSMLEGVSTGNAIIAQSTVSPTKPFRAGFDILLPPLRTAEGAWINLLHPLLPLSRETFVHFHGEYSSPQDTIPGAITPDVIESFQGLLQRKEKDDIQLQCQESASKTAGVEGEWMLCGDQESRLKLCSKSMFSLIPSPGGRTGVSIYTRLIESLMCGSVPVVIGVGVLPFDDVIDWSRAALVIPSARYSDLLHILRSINKNDFHNFRLKGRHLWYTYFRSPLRVVQISVAIVRSRTLHPPPTAPEYVGKQLLYLPAPNHKHIPSPSFPSSFTAYTTSFWNDIPGPLYTYPTSPFNLGAHFSTLSEASAAHNASQSADKRNAIEKEYKDNLLANIPNEQFTIIILTYKRTKVLMEGLAKLKGIISLNKVVVVWNDDEEDPSPKLKWPNIGVPIVVVRTEKNSMNNKFLPLKDIETEAVLELDDDVLLDPREIEFGFRVWCENRDRLVGFLARHHSYSFKDDKWVYDFKGPGNCKVSMVLTSSTFFHKMYLYLYSYWMPEEIRKFVDLTFNCDDLALNFLIAHVSRKPPMKVPTGFTFDCSTSRCGDNISKRAGHMKKRVLCLEYYTHIYGYMPLLYTQSRTDPVSTKIPKLSQYGECFKHT